MTACNNIENQNPDLENRFTLGKQFYDLERAACRGENIYVYMYTYIIYIYIYIYKRKGKEQEREKKKKKKKKKKNGEIRQEFRLNGPPCPDGTCILVAVYKGGGKKG